MRTPGLPVVVRRGCWHFPLRPRVCESCAQFLKDLEAEKRDARAQQTDPDPAGLSLRELRRLNQQRIRDERGGAA